MDTINNTKIIFNAFYGLFLLAVLAFGVTVIPAKASAYEDVYGSWGNNPTILNNQYTYTPVYVPVPAPVYVNPAPVVSAPIIYSSSTNPDATTAPQTPTKAKTTSSLNTPAVETKTSAPSNLAANAVFGSTNSFMPSGLIEWVLFAILVLIIVILVRKIYGGSEKYHAMPMKHK